MPVQLPRKGVAGADRIIDVVSSISSSSSAEFSLVFLLSHGNEGNIFPASARKYKPTLKFPTLTVALLNRVTTFYFRHTVCRTARTVTLTITIIANQLTDVQLRYTGSSEREFSLNIAQRRRFQLQLLTVTCYVCPWVRLSFLVSFRTASTVIHFFPK